MSTKFNDLTLLTLFGKIRRQLNLKATHDLKPLGIGPKQAIFMRELRALKIASPSELARLTQTDPAATGKVIQTLTKKGWIQRSDHPNDRRQWQVSLTASGIKASAKIDETFTGIAEALCSPLNQTEKSALLKLFTKITGGL